VDEAEGSARANRVKEEEEEEEEESSTRSTCQSFDRMASTPHEPTFFDILWDSTRAITGACILNT
jgi:hypothetical protein